MQVQQQWLLVVPSCTTQHLSVEPTAAHVSYPCRLICRHICRGSLVDNGAAPNSHGREHSLHTSVKAPTFWAALGQLQLAPDARRPGSSTNTAPATSSHGTTPSSAAAAGMVGAACSPSACQAQCAGQSLAPQMVHSAPATEEHEASADQPSTVVDGGSGSLRSTSRTPPPAQDWHDMRWLDDDQHPEGVYSG